MTKLRATAIVGNDGELELKLKTNLRLGRHDLILLVDEEQADGPRSDWRPFPSVSVGVVDPGWTFDREEFYGDLNR